MDVFGKKRTELRVEIDMEKLHAYGMSLENVSKVLSENNIEFGFGKLKNDNGYISLRADNQLKEHEDFRDITLISEAGGAKVLLRDVAKIVDGYEDDDLKAVYQGHNSVGIILYTSNKGHLIEVSDAAKKIVDKLQKQSPPEGVYIDIWADASAYMINRLMLLQSNAWQGLLIVFVILAVFLNFKLAFWVAAGIPFSIAGALALMGESFLNYSLNDVTTFGFIIVLGILVDDAVVVGESVFEERQKNTDPVEGTIMGVHKVAVATVFGVLTTIAAFFPITLIKK